MEFQSAQAFFKVVSEVPLPFMDCHCLLLLDTNYIQSNDFFPV